MGLLDRFFKRVRQQAAVPVDELPSWYAARAKPLIVKLQLQSAEHIREAKAQQEQLRTQLNMLRTAKLQNETIPQRVRDIMEGSRQQFLRAAQFLIEFEIPSHATSDELKPFLEQLTTALSQFTQSTKRAAAVLSEFFAHDIKAIFATIARVEGESHAAFPQEYRKLLQLEQDIAAIDTVQEAADRLAASLQHVEQQHTHLVQQIAKIRAEGDAAKRGREYTLLLDLEQRQQGLLQKQQRIRSVVSELFSPLTPALKKLAHDGVHADRIDPYLNDPFAALSDDRQFQILETLQTAGQHLAEGKLGLRDEKAERVQRGLAAITQQVLADHLAQAAAIEDELRKLKGQIAGNTVRNRVAEAEYRVEHLQRKAEGVSAEAEKIRKAMARTESQSFDALAAELSTALDVDVRIT